MNAATITPIRPPKAKGSVTIAPKVASRYHAKRLRRQGVAAVAIGAVAIVLTALSLSHLAHGIVIVTSAPAWEAWAMAAGIDIGFIALEISQLTAATEKVRIAIQRWATPAILGTLAGSAVMNAFAFAAPAQGYMIAAAILMGVAIPALIYALTRICATLYIDCHSKG